MVSNILLAQAETFRPQGRNPNGVRTTSFYHSNIIISYYPSICTIHRQVFVGCRRNPVTHPSTNTTGFANFSIFFQHCDRLSLITGCGRWTGLKYLHIFNELILASQKFGPGRLPKYKSKKKNNVPTILLEQYSFQNLAFDIGGYHTNAGSLRKENNMWASQKVIGGYLLHTGSTKT